MQRLASIQVLTPMTVIVPTYEEVENIPLLLSRLDALRQRYDLDLEVLVMDDDSADGTAAAVAAFGADWCRAIVRTQDRGLSAAVVDGLRAATKPVVVVMDADLSHPPEAIPSMVLALEAGHDFVIGSRYVAGGTTDDDWGVLRWLNSRIATWLSRPLTPARDPMAGFFALRRSALDAAGPLDPIGYKIGLELIVKCHVTNVAEIPIHFEDRRLGRSKLSWREQMRFVAHLRRLYAYRLGTWSELGRFVTVGTIGTAVNLLVLTLATAAGAAAAISFAIAILVSMLANFVVDRQLAARHAHGGPFVRELQRFLAFSAFGALVNFLVAVLVHGGWPGLPLQIAALLGIAAGAAVNLTANRYGAFRRRHVRP